MLILSDSLTAQCQYTVEVKKKFVGEATSNICQETSVSGLNDTTRESLHIFLLGATAVSVSHMILLDFIAFT